MSRNESRLDVPGFSFGEKTGVFIDVPKIYGGRPQPKRSGRPHTLEELLGFNSESRANRSVQLASKIAREDHFRIKRSRHRGLRQAITNVAAIRPCTRRFLEQMGMKSSFIAYSEKPELFISKAKTAYELTDGLLPMMSTTSAREALIICASLARRGIAAYFNKIAVPHD